MTLTDIWQTLPPEARSFLLGLAGKPAEALLKGAASTLRAAARGTEVEQALRESLTRAVAAFLACLDLPEGPQERRDWEAHVHTLLGPLFADERVQEALLRAVLYEGRPEGVDVAPFRAAWAAHHGEGSEATLPWREGQSLETAARAFARAFEEEVQSRPALHTFVLTARFRQLADRLQRGVPVEGMDALIRAVEGLAQQQERLIALFTDLARQGYSVSVRGDVTGSLIITGDNNTVSIPDGGRLTALFRNLPEPTRALAEYRAHIRRSCALLPLEGLALPEIHGRPLDPARLRIPLDRVYIRLRALPYRDRPEEPEDARTLARYLRDRHREHWQWEKQYPAPESQAIPSEEAVARHPQLVILGDPGAGKSTFLRHLAWAWAETDALPLLVPLGRADVAMAGGRPLLEAALDHLTGHKVGAEREALRAALEEEIREKRVCWLWDGLDEVRRHRREVVEALGRLAADGHRMVVTSRPVGYEPIPGCDALYEVLPLLPEDARAFTDRWFRALAESRGVPEGERERWAGERSGWLRTQLEERPGLQEVARNPLMLTFLAVLAGDEPRRDLPRRRKDLYALYIERLFTTWEEQRRPGEEKSLLPGVEDPNEAREMLLWGFRRVALHLHRAYGEQPERAARPGVKDALAEELAEEAELGRFQAAARAEAILKFWERAGLLDVYRLGGRELLAFRHLTFQEYGAARALAEAYRKNPDGLWAELRLHLLDDEWAEVIPLALAHLEDATPLLDRLLEASAQDESHQRPLFQAAAALAEGARAAEETGRQVIDRLEHIARLTGLTRTPLFYAFSAVAAIGEMEGNSYASARLLIMTRDNALDTFVRVEAARALRALNQTEEAVQAWLALSQDEQMDTWVQEEAIRIMGDLGRADDLLAMACSKKIKTNMRVKAARTLSKLGWADKAAQAWIVLARSRELNPKVRIEAVKALGNISSANKFATTLLDMSKNDKEDVRIRAEAARTLSKLGQIEKAIQAWLTLTKDERIDAQTRADAIWSLGQIGQVSNLLTLVLDREIPTWVRMEAARTISQMNYAEEAVQAWLALAQEEELDPSTRLQAAKALGQLGQADQAASILLTLVQGVRIDEMIRLEAAKLAGEFGLVDSAASILIAYAQNEGASTHTRIEAAKTLEKLGKVNMAAQAWLTLIQDKKIGARIWSEAIETLSRLGRSDELLTIIQDNTIYLQARIEAVRALSNFDQVNYLLNVAKSNINPQVRLEAVKLLKGLGQTFALLTLSQDEKVNIQVRLASARALHNLGLGNEVRAFCRALARNKKAKIQARIEAVRLLGEVGRADDLLTLAQDRKANSQVRREAVRALGKHGRAEHLRILAWDKRTTTEIRVTAIEALSRLGQALITPEVLEDLRALTEDELTPQEVRRAARNLLQKLPLD